MKRTFRFALMSPRRCANTIERQNHGHVVTKPDLPLVLPAQRRAARCCKDPNNVLSTKTRASEWTKYRQFGRLARKTVGASESQPGKRYRVTDHLNPNIPNDPKCVSTSWYCVDTTKACFRPRALVIRVWCCCKFKCTPKSSAEDLCVSTTCTRDTAKMKRER